MDFFTSEAAMCCEDCYYFSYINVKLLQVIDAEGYGKYAESAKSGLINRVRCRHCGAEFTYELPLLLYSMSHNIAAYACCDEPPPENTRFRYAMQLVGMGDINLRYVRFASEAAEKIRIAMDGFDDLKMELFKFKEFPEYEKMDVSDEYITYERVEDNNLVFTRRNFKEDLLKTMTVDIDNYKEFKPILPQVPTGVWCRADKTWAKNYLEENKCI